MAIFQIYLERKHKMYLCISLFPKVVSRIQALGVSEMFLEKNPKTMPNERGMGTQMTAGF